MGTPPFILTSTSMCLDIMIVVYGAWLPLNGNSTQIKLSELANEVIVAAVFIGIPLWR